MVRWAQGLCVYRIWIRTKTKMRKNRKAEGEKEQESSERKAMNYGALVTVRRRKARVLLLAS